MKTMKSTLLNLAKTLSRRAGGSWLRLAAIVSGAAALVWFLVRVIPKPSRASYPCQRAAFPVASGFVLWLCGVVAIKSGLKRLARIRFAACCGLLTVLAVAAWTLISFTGNSAAQNAGKPPTDWNFIPAKPNEPVGIARGINPGRVVWARDPQATKWAGNWKQKSDQWWLDANTDQARVDAMLAATLLKLTSATNGEQAWRAIFEYYNKNSRSMDQRGYQPGEVVAVKINLNNSEDGVKADNYTDASPQMVLAMIRQLVNQAHVRPQDIIVYDVRRLIPPYILTKVWSEFKDVRFIQASPPKASQPKNPGYGDYHGLETPDWVEGVVYSNGKYKEAKLIPKQIFDATYLVNLALLKAHSYPYNNMEDGDAGQTAISMCGKNHFGSIKGPWELHAIINPDQEAVKNAYSPSWTWRPRPISARRRFCMCSTGFTAGANGALTRCIFRIRRSTTASSLTKIRTGRRACWPRWTAWRWIPWGWIFCSRRPKTTTTRTAIRAFCSAPTRTIIFLKWRSRITRRRARFTNRMAKWSPASASMNAGTATPPNNTRAISIRPKARASS